MPRLTAVPSRMKNTGDAPLSIENAAPVLRMCTMLKCGMTGSTSNQPRLRTINCLVIWSNSMTAAEIHSQ